MSKIGYGLNLSLPSQQKKKQQQQQQSTKLPHPPAFRFNDNDEDDVESDISRQASKNKYLKDTEEQQKKALKEDPTVFDYDGVYDDMKLKAIQPQVQDHQDRMDHEWRQAVTAAGSGCVAALSVERYLVSKDLLIEFHQGVKQVLVKLGAKGSALSVDGEEPIKQPLISAPKVLDTTGARYTFTAAFVVALVEGKSRNESLKFSAAAASLCVQVKGALPSMPDRKSVLALLQSH